MIARASLPAGEGIMGTYSVHLVGESKFQDAIDLLVEGERVSLVHEPDNRYDKAAVKAVDSEGSTIGYIERDNWLQRVIVDERKEVYAEVEEIIGGEKGKPMKGVILMVATAKDAEALRNESPEQRRARIKASYGAGCMAILAITAIAPLAAYWI
jgi:hypothetical protein